MTSFSTHMQNLAREFIGTVLFVDDKITNDFLEQHPIIYDESPPGHDALTDAEKLVDPQDNHILNMKKLSSFSSNNMLCCPFCTDPISTLEAQSNTVDRVCKLSKKADVLVLDWKMEDEGGPVGVGTTAREIIERLSGSPYSDRTILVCIFSAENEENINAHELCKKNVHVFYSNKNTPESYENLPNLIVKEFAQKHSGLLTGAALSAIKVVRDNTSRIISRFSHDHDISYLSHRCLLTNPQDAEIFASELMAATVEDLIKGNETIINTLSDGVLNCWVDEKCGHHEQRSLNLKHNQSFQINNIFKKEWLYNGLEKWLIENQVSEKDAASFIRKIKGIGKYFHNEFSEENEFERQASFAKLTSHTFSDATNNNGSIYLSLGSVLKGESEDYYLCIQPLCDSVRLENDYNNKFIFLRLEKKNIDPANTNIYFHIIVEENVAEGLKNVYLKVSEKISQIETFRFKPTAENDKVIMKTGESIPARVNSTDNKIFTFLTQLRPSKAQQIAVKFLGQITRIGIDESEWLRRHSN